MKPPGAAARIAAIVRADVLIRFRRVSTVIVFLLLSSVAYLWIPDPSTGRALLQIGGRRAILDSAAIGMATASIATIFIGLVGFYVISNALRRDAASRCGFVIASTTMKSGEYLFGKFVGNVLFLVTFIAGFMLTSMAMVVVRGEAPLQPLVFVAQYLILIPPAITYVSALAVLFESVRWLSGRLGDVLYFFLWLGGLGTVASMTDPAGTPRWVYAVDYSGFAYLFDSMRQTMGGASVAIGASTFDATKPPIAFPGLELQPEWLLSRALSLLTPLLLLVVARFFFHRFDPVRVRVAAGGGGRGWAVRANLLLKPFSRLLELVAWTPRRPTLAGSAFIDARMTLAAMPAALIAMGGFAAVAIASSPAEVRSGLLPLAIATAGVFIADVSCRERRAGTLGLVFAAPLLKRRFVAWKLLASALLASAFVAVPAIRAADDRPDLLPAIAVGTFFVAAMATALGVLSSNPKTFIVLFLTFLYIVMNEKGNPGFDFAGFHGIATPKITAAYGAAAIAAIIAAEIFHRTRMRRT